MKETGRVSSPLLGCGSTCKRADRDYARGFPQSGSRSYFSLRDAYKPHAEPEIITQSQAASIPRPRQTPWRQSVARSGTLSVTGDTLQEVGHEAAIICHRRKQKCFIRIPWRLGSSDKHLTKDGGQ